ncbi:MAG: hypothetical protein NVS4B9_31780 [Ktedonobacteraceae bacterium]
MFSFGKKSANQENVLQDLNEEQLTQVAGGVVDKDVDAVLHPSKSSKSVHHHHHHHHHHHVKDVDTKAKN